MYEEYFGLSGSPFRLNPDPKYFFGSQSHNKALAYLHYGLKQAEGLIVITGPVGAGKSTLIASLLSQLNRSNVVAAHLLTSSVEPDQLLAHILSAFRIEPEGEGKAGQLEAFEDFLFDQLNRGRRVLLIMDEAQNLPRRTLEELRMLTNIDYEGTPLFQVFLVGQPEFRGTMADPRMEQLRQRVIANYHLEDLTVEETREYILHRLTVAGWRADPKISDEAFERIFSETEGRPRRINTLCNRVMLHCALEQIHEITGDVVDAVVAELHAENLGVAANVEAAPEIDAAEEARRRVREVVEKQIFEREKKAASGEVVVPIERARSKSNTNGAPKAEATRAMRIEAETPQAVTTPANEPEQAAVPEATVEPDEFSIPATGLRFSKLQSSASVLDRLRMGKRGSDGDNPQRREATLQEIASAIRAAAEHVKEPRDVFDEEAESEAAEDKAPTAKSIEAIPPSDDAAALRRSIVRSINDTRDELKQAHANVLRLKHKLTDMNRRRHDNRVQIVASLSRAEDLLQEIRNVWR